MGFLAGLGRSLEGFWGFQTNDLGFISKIVASDGSAVVYSYDEAGQLLLTRRLDNGVSSQYAYNDAHLLNLAVGESGEAISYGATPEVLPVKDNLGTANKFTEAVNGSLVDGQIERYSFTIRDSELAATATGRILLGVEVQGINSLPVIAGLNAVASRIEGNSAFALFVIEKAGLNLLSLSGVGDYQLKLSVAGDLNADGTVDGIDSQLIMGASDYAPEFDLNRDGVVNAADVQILGSNYGFAVNRAPSVNNAAVLTHEDLGVRINLADLATDAEGDEIFFRGINSQFGEVSFAADGKTAWFKPTLGYTGTTTFELIADDGFNLSAPAVITVNVSDAPLVNLDLVERNPKLETGEQLGLKVVGDFADQEDVELPWDYLSFASSSPDVGMMSAQGVVTGLLWGTTILSVERDGIEAVTVARVGKIPAPTDEETFNLALAEEEGLDIYPDAVTLTPGINRQILVTINGELESPPDFLSGVSTGTQYFVSNPQVLSVSADGLITTLNEGVANVTVIYGGTEAVLPVRVESPHLGATTLGKEGGVVQGADGSMVMIPQGALEEEATVNITPLTLNDLSVATPENFSFVGAFNLDLGVKDLALPAQLAVPAPEGLAPGTEVFFMREGQIPDETGTLNPIWFLEESGRVGTDGFIRTSSPPWQGAKNSGKYSIAIPESDYLTGKLAIQTASIGSVAIGATYVTATALGSNPGGAGVAIAAIAGVAGLIIFTWEKFSVDVITVPKIGLPYKTSKNIELNLGQIAPSLNPFFAIDVPPPNQISNTPVVENVVLDFDEEGPLVRIIGSNFGNSPDNLTINLEYGAQTGEQTEIIPIESNESGIKEFSFRVPNHLPISENLTAKVVREIIQSDSSKYSEESNKFGISVPERMEQTYTVDRFKDEVSVINTLNASDTVEESGSKNLLLGRIPIGTEGKSDLPRNLAATNDTSRIYLPLEGSHSIAVLDSVGIRPLDTNPQTEQIDTIYLDNSATPSSIAIEPQDRFAYIGDLINGNIYYLNINPKLAKNPDPSKPKADTYYHDYGTIEYTKDGGIRQLAINSDGTRLFATTEKQILVFNINPQSGIPTFLAKIPSAQAGLEGIAATPYPNKMIFTNRNEDGYGFGVVELNKDGTGNITKTAPLSLGETDDYFDVNEAVSVVMVRHASTGEEYAFIAGRNNRFLGSGIQSVDGDPRAGSNVGIIKDPLGSPQLIAATRPIPNGYASDLVVSGDGKYLTVSYPFVGTFVFDVREIIKTINEPNNQEQLSKKPIEEINKQISVAANPLFNDFPLPDWLLPKDSPIDARFSLGLGQLSKNKLIDGIEQEVQSSPEAGEKPNIVFKWTAKNGFQFPPETEPEEEKEKQKLLLDLPLVELYVSTFPEEEGLFPKDWTPEGYDKGKKDYNPNRVLTANYIEGAWHLIENINLEQGITKKIKTNQTNPFEFILPKDRQLTAGQTYHWGIRVKGVITSAVASAFGLEVKKDSKPGSFKVPLAQLPLQTDPSSVTPPSVDTSQTFNSVTILTRGVEPGDDLHDTLIDQKLYALAKQITREKGVVLDYNNTTGEWETVKFIENASNTKFWYPQKIDSVTYKYGEPLVLLADWMEGIPKTNLYNAGFAEAAADTLFASLVNLDGGSVGNGTNLYNTADGSLIRNQGNLFNSPLHFIGFGQGAVVNSEIIQRLGTYFPNAGGISAANRDLQMTTIDPFSYNSTNSQGIYANILDPTIEVWTNVTYADNYYQNKGTGDTLNGQEILNADLNVSLGNLAGFEKNTDKGFPHRSALTWYLGTENLSYGQDETHDLNDGIVYRRLGDLYPKKKKKNVEIKPSTTWYTPDHKNANFKDQNGNFENGHKDAPWEGIGTGWFYSVLGGGYEQRIYQSTSIKTPVWQDNTYTDVLIGNRFKGDRGVPTLYNGNFDAISFDNIGDVIPGWSIKYKQNPQLIVNDDVEPLNNSLQDNLVTWNDIKAQSPSFGSYLDKINYNPQETNFALKLGGDNGARAITHNNLLIPDWGDLRFNLHVLEEGTGRLIVSFKGSKGFSKKKVFELKKANGSISEYENDKLKIGYGFEGFETFRFDLSKTERKDLQEQQATLTFKLQGAANNTVYLDDVFFQSEDLLLGNPTNARYDSINYAENFLIEKAQYSVSYNSKNNTANWVSWHMNKSWLAEKDPASRPDFQEDPDIGKFGWFQVRNNDYKEEFTNLNITYKYPNLNTGYQTSILEAGHLVAASDQRRHKKDYVSTFLTTNIFPQDYNNNHTGWRALEDYLKDGAKNYGKDYYIIAGGLGTNANKNSIEVVDANGQKQEIKVPAFVWKVVIELPRVGASIEDPQTTAFAVYMRNTDITGEKWDKPENVMKMSIEQLEARLNQDKTLPYKYNFFSGRDDIRKNLIGKNKNPYVKALLLADSDLNSSLDNLSPTLSTSNTSIWHDGIVQNSIFEINILDSTKISSTKVSSTKNSSTEIGSNQFSISQISIDELSMSEFSSAEIGSSEIAISKGSHPQICSPQISFPQISSPQKTLTQIGISQIASTQIDSSQTRGDHLESRTSEISSTQANTIHFSCGIPDFNFGKLSFPSSITFEQFFNSNTFSFHDSHPQVINKIDNTALNLWNSFIQTQNPININFQITNLPTGQLAEAQITDFDSSGNPIGGTILIDDDANGVGWYIDPNPQDNSEYAYTLADWAYQATPDSPAYGKYDLLTTILHETAHLFGFIDGFWAFDKRIQTLDGTRYFIGDDFTATLDGEHLDKNAHPYDLLNTHLAPGMRKLPSDLDVKILQLLLAEESKSVGTSLVDTETPSAPLTSAPLVGIANSDFSIDDPNNPLFGWNTRGKTQILNQQAVLSENSPLQSKFSQSFTIPENAKTLQFTLINSQLGTDFLPDAVEVALLDANTNISLVDTVNGLTNTDAFINLQDDGIAYFSNNVNLPGAQSSGTPINPNTPRTIQLDISNLTPGQIATLSFDLLGLGAKDAEVTIDNVIILTDDSIAPIANNDTASTTSTQPITINVINNDSDTDGSIDPTTLQLATSPSNGNVTINNDGTFTYTPNPDFGGTDSFTYTIADNTGALSNEATVSIEVINPKPTITDISYTSDIAEGTPATFTATATDTNSDILTYSWDFGDGQQLLGNQVSYTFANSGTYPVTVTVTDSDGNVVVNPLPTLKIEDLILTEGDSGNTEAIFTVSLNEARSREVTVNFTTENGTAIADRDYTATTGTITFAPGQTTQNVSVSLLGDTSIQFS